MLARWLTHLLGFWERDQGRSIRVPRGCRRRSEPTLGSPSTTSPLRSLTLQNEPTAPPEHLGSVTEQVEATGKAFEQQRYSESSCRDRTSGYSGGQRTFDRGAERGTGTRRTGREESSRRNSANRLSYHHTHRNAHIIGSQWRSGHCKRRSHATHRNSAYRNEKTFGISEEAFRRVVAVTGWSRPQERSEQRA